MNFKVTNENGDFATYGFGPTLGRTVHQAADRAVAKAWREFGEDRPEANSWTGPELADALGPAFAMLADSKKINLH